MAITLPHSKPVSFGELLRMGAQAQSLYRRHGLQPGDSVLLFDHLSPRLYASVIGVLAMGASVVLVEPWMPIEKINRAIRLVKPKIFVAGTIGKLWGLRLRSVREIPSWVNPGRLAGEPSRSELRLESVEGDARGILTFTSGTTGAPKGVVRSQGYLIRQHLVLSRALGLEAHAGPDLCIFANFALANLGAGRGSIIVPSQWRAKDLKWIGALASGGNPAMAPASLTTGPAFLLNLMNTARMPSLESIHVGGALTDCWIFEKAFAHFPRAHIMHIYGSSEAEPVALVDAKEAVRLSREKGYFQTLYLGKPVNEIEAEVQPDDLWVTGPHVCPEYLGGEEENRLYKKRDAHGRVWHSMGDRVRVDEDGAWWYAGRSGQRPESFELEQQIYSLLGTSKAFIVDEEAGRSLCVEPPSKLGGPRLAEAYERLRKLSGSGPERLRALYEVKISRDRRHRARIDRKESLKTRKLWRVG